jgi:hypothetical protein
MDNSNEIDLPIQPPQVHWVEKKLYLLATERNYLGFWNPTCISDNRETTQVWIRWPTMLHVLKDLQDAGKIDAYVLYCHVKKFQFYLPDSDVCYCVRPKTCEYFDLFLNKWQLIKVFNLNITLWQWLY